MENEWDGHIKHSESRWGGVKSFLGENLLEFRWALTPYPMHTPAPPFLQFFPLALTQDFDGPCLRCGRRHCCLVLAAEQSRCPRGLRGWTQEETWGFQLKQRRGGNLPPKSTFCGPQNVVLCLCYLQLPWNKVRWCCFPWQFWSFFQPKGVWGLWRELGQQKHVSRQFNKKLVTFRYGFALVAGNAWKCTFSYSIEWGGFPQTMQNESWVRTRSNNYFYTERVQKLWQMSQPFMWIFSCHLAEWSL